REGVFVADAPVAAAGVRAIAAPPLPALRTQPSVGHQRVGSADISLSTVFIDSEILPRDKLADCARSVLKSPGLSAFYEPQGLGSLRELIAKRLRDRGMTDVTAANVIVTTGSQQAIDILSRTLEVRRVAMESPVYSGAKLLIESQGIQTTGLVLDPFLGIPVDLWEKQLATARPGLLYCITSYQNPTGYSYTSHELSSVLELAEKYGFAIAEDDWGSDMLSGSEYRPMLRLLGGSNVVYINSFTKKLLPSLRVGFMVADERLVPALVTAKRLATLGNAWITEAIVAEFLDRGYYDTHLIALQRELDTRYAACLYFLRELMPEGVRWTLPGGGPTLWLDLPRKVDLGMLEARLGARGVRIEGVANAFFGEPHLHGFRVSYAFSPTAKLRCALEIVAEEVRALL
ncbi:MAG TPA: PLP-dependent aminotransferase family protein, partial [Polyangiaceae bacterium]|nr:PLP-dependent aminotransferase family protein [Polyangiaceae bacterium]